MRLAIAAALTALIAGAANAQSVNNSANYGEVRLSPGFTPDPGLMKVQAGGALEASSRFKGCNGWISDSPDLRLYWDGTGSLPLILSAVSNGDTTLVVNGPRGDWYCDDDSGEGTNPSIRLTAEQGRYEIWVGTYSQGQTQPSVISISELASF